MTMARKERGFTLVELLVVLAIIATLLSLAAPRYTGSVDKAKESVLRENLFTLRSTLDKFYGDKGTYPSTLDDLVKQRYLRKIPIDPITDSDTTWVIVAPPAPQKGAVFDVKSGATGTARDGTAYKDW
ncbi:MAG: type II secretion system protein [Rhodocyclaceae bacterium]|nr:MAG: type II secretion system protein [Rhodocyclaceae bacterium]